MPEPTDATRPGSTPELPPADERPADASLDAAEGQVVQEGGGPPEHWLAYIRAKAPHLLAPDGGIGEGWWSYSDEAGPMRRSSRGVLPPDRPVPVAEPARVHSEERAPPAAVAHERPEPPPRRTAPPPPRAAEGGPAPRAFPRTERSPRAPAPAPAREPIRTTVAHASRTAAPPPPSATGTAPPVPSASRVAPATPAPSATSAPVAPARPARQEIAERWAPLPRSREMARALTRSSARAAVQAARAALPVRYAERERSEVDLVKAAPRTHPPHLVTPRQAHLVTPRRPTARVDRWRAPMEATTPPWPSLLEPDDDDHDIWPEIERRRERAERLAREQRGR